MKETEGRGMITNMDLKVYIGGLKNNPRITEEMLRLVEEDLRFGLTPGETEEYIGKKLDYAQMKVYSRCLRSGYGRDAVKVITKEGLSGEQMAVALEFYEKGVPLDAVAEITKQTGQTAFSMRQLFADVMDKLETAGRNADAGEAYAGEILEQIRRVVEKIDFQEKRYDDLNERLKEIQTAGQETEAYSRLRTQLEEKDRLIKEQQDAVRRAQAESDRLRGELELVRREKLLLESRTGEPGQGFSQPEGGLSHSKQQEKGKHQPEQPGQGGSQLEMGCGSYAVSGMSAEAYQEADHRKMQWILGGQPPGTEECRSAKRQRQGGKKKGILAFLLSGAKPDQGTDIIKMVAEKGLKPDQLVQIRKGIEKGLNREQLMVLISHPLPAVQMEEIINIAVYENRQEGEV